jgi:hypothetical protein
MRSGFLLRDEAATLTVASPSPASVIRSMLIHAPSVRKPRKEKMKNSW